MYWYLLGILTLGISTIISLRVPDLSKAIINAIEQGTADLDGFQKIAFAIIGLGLLQIIFRALSRLTIFWPGRKIEAHIKSDLFHRILYLPQTFFDEVGLGDLTSRISNDTGHLRVFFAFAVLQILNIIYLTVFTISKMYSVHPKLTLFCLTPLLLLILLSRLIVPKLHHYSKKTNEMIGSLTNGVTEAFANIHTIKANAAEDTFAVRLQKINENLYHNNVKLLGVRTAIFPLVSSLASLAQLIVLFYGGGEVIAGNLSVGDILAFNFYISLMSFPLTAIGIILAIQQRAKAAVERHDLIRQAPLEATAIENEKPTTYTESKLVGHKELIQINDLSFSFSADNDPVLHNVNLSITEGKKIGIFGAIGSGKSTLLNLITRIYNPPQGMIYWCGTDVLKITPRDLRKDIFYVPQKPYLFSDSIIKNLTFGLDSAVSQHDLDKACLDADILQDILSFKNTWDTQVGEQGIKLSGGQKQRIALARMFLRRPKVVVLDDVLSAVDQNTEQNILRAIYNLGCAFVLSSHRPSALSGADEIILLDSGHVTHRGTFEELKEHMELVARAVPEGGAP